VDSIENTLFDLSASFAKNPTTWLLQIIGALYIFVIGLSLKQNPTVPNGWFISATWSNLGQQKLSRKILVAKFGAQNYCLVVILGQNPAPKLQAKTSRWPKIFRPKFKIKLWDQKVWFTIRAPVLEVKDWWWTF